MTAQPPSPPTAPDWGAGHYERTAAQLAPAAELVVARAAPGRGERVLDVGCGTGNAALLVAARGAHATGVDPAPRLLEVARARAAEQGLEARFSAGEAAALPVADGDADVVVSVFGVIFAPDAPAAAAELARVTAPAGRIVLSAWLPGGALGDAARASRSAVAAAFGTPAGPPPFPWHERDALERLLGPCGFRVHTEERGLAFTGASPREFLDGESANHPLAVAGRAVLEASGDAAALERCLLEIYTAANEDPEAFRVTSRYVVAIARRDG